MHLFYIKIGWKETLKIQCGGGYKMAGCNEQNCTCPKADCERHGKCCECINFHREKENLVHCLREIAKKN